MSPHYQPLSEQTIGRLLARVDALEFQNLEQQKQLDELRDLRSKGQGIWWFLTIVGGLFIAIGLAKVKDIIDLISGSTKHP